MALEPSSSRISQEFTEELPATLSFSDRMGTAQLASLTSPLDSTGSIPVTEFRTGDVGYWSSTHSVIVFLSDTSAAPRADVYLLGHVTSGLEDLSGCIRDCEVRLTVDKSASAP